MNNETRQQLKNLLNTRDFFQKLRIKASNYIEIRKDGSKNNSFGKAKIDEDTIPIIVDFINDCKEQEDRLAKQIDEVVINDPMWNGFFKGIKGIGSMGAAYILAYIDIEKGSTRARIYQYCGLNPSMVRAKKINSKTYEIKETDFMIRGDKLTSGYMCPYNSYLRSRLYGIVASGIIKAGCRTNKETGEIIYSKYYKIYSDRKNRMKNSRKPVYEGSDRLWCDETAAHLDMDARRYMIKELLSDFYEVYRAQEGLEVRPRYSEEYLGRVHHA